MLNSQQWSGPITVKQVVWEAVLELTDGDVTVEFAIKDVKPIITEKYPDYKLSNVGAEISADCVNSPSRRHYTVNKDRYWKVRYGIYRLYDPKRDKVGIIR